MNGKSKCTILVDKEKAVNWIKENRDTDVGNTPLWVLISLGVRALNEEKEETDPRCKREYNNGTLHVHENKCRPCRHYETCEYIKFIKFL